MENEATKTATTMLTVRLPSEYRRLLDALKGDMLASTVTEVVRRLVDAEIQRRRLQR